MHSTSVFRAVAMLLAAITGPATASCQISDIHLEGPPEGALSVSAWWPEQGGPAFVWRTDVVSQPQLYVIRCADAECDSQSRQWLDHGASVASAPAVFTEPNISQPSIVSAHPNGLRNYRCADADCTSWQMYPLPASAGVTQHSNIVRWGAHDWALAYVGVGAEAGDLKLLHCQNPDCSSHETRTLMQHQSSDPIVYRQLALARSGAGALALASLAVALSDPAQSQYRLSLCDEASCNHPVHRDILTVPPSPELDRIALAFQNDGRLLLLDPRQSEPRLLSCADASCLSVEASPLPHAQGEWYAGLAVSAHGWPVLGQIQAGQAGFLKCLDAQCQSYASTLLPLPLSSPRSAELSRNQHGDWLLTHVDYEEGQAHATRCLQPESRFSSSFEDSDGSD